MTCQTCHERPVKIVKSLECQRCYQRAWKARNAERLPGYAETYQAKIQAREDQGLEYRRPLGPKALRLTEVSYAGAHSRVRSLMGPATDYVCAFCCRKAGAEWAYTPTNGPQWQRRESTPTTLPSGRQVQRAYSIHPSDYQPTCYTCHRDEFWTGAQAYQAKRRAA